MTRDVLDCKEVMLSKNEKSSKSGKLFYTKAGIGRKGVSSEGIRKNLDLIKHIAKSVPTQKKLATRKKS